MNTCGEYEKECALGGEADGPLPDDEVCEESVKPNKESVDFNFIPSTPLTKSFSYFSPVPSVCMAAQEVILGVDEAGRGPVLGPMVYAIAYCPKEKNSTLKALGVQDSKVLDGGTRDKLLTSIQSNNDWLGWAVHVNSPQDISESMLRVSKYNLNALAHDTTIDLIKGALARNVNVKEVYVDTVGPPQQYQDKLQRIFPGLKITVAKKADSIYPSVSAASICAKVTRDQILENWNFVENGLNESASRQFGSGYPGDQKTIRWLKESLDKIFGFPRIIRFSWQTTEKMLDENCVKVKWPCDEPEEGVDIRKFFSGKGSRKRSAEDECGDATAAKQVVVVADGRQPWLRDFSGVEFKSTFV